MTFKVTYDLPKSKIRWASERLAGAEFRDDAVAIGNERNGDLCAVAVFDTFTPTSCQVSLVSDGSKRWMTREFIAAGFAYPFITCGFPNIYALVSEHNEAALKLNLHFGWKEIVRLDEDGLHGETNILLRMKRRECRWLPASFVAVAPSQVAAPQV